MKTIGIGIVACLAMSACTPFEIVNDISTVNLPDESQINLNELYWEPHQIADMNCPDVDGTYKIPAGLFHRRDWGLNIAGVTLAKSKSLKAVDILLTIKKGRAGVVVRGQTSEEDETKVLSFNQRFGCAQGEFVLRHNPFYFGGAESGICRSVSYGESHWKPTPNGDLMVTTVYRKRCWVQRGEDLPQFDVINTPQIFIRVGSDGQQRRI